MSGRCARWPELRARPGSPTRSALRGGHARVCAVRPERYCRGARGCAVTARRARVATAVCGDQSRCARCSHLEVCAGDQRVRVVTLCPWTPVAEHTARVHPRGRSRTAPRHGADLRQRLSRHRQRSARPTGRTAWTTSTYGRCGGRAPTGSPASASRCGAGAGHRGPVVRAAGSAAGRRPSRRPPGAAPPGCRAARVAAPPGALCRAAGLPGIATAAGCGRARQAARCAATGCAAVRGQARADVRGEAVPPVGQRDAGALGLRAVQHAVQRAAGGVRACRRSTPRCVVSVTRQVAVPGRGEHRPGDVGPGRRLAAAGDVVAAVRGPRPQQVHDRGGDVRGERRPPDLVGHHRRLDPARPARAWCARSSARRRPPRSAGPGSAAPAR